MLYKLANIRRAPWINDYNLLVDAVNSIIDRLNSKIEIENVNIYREVKDFKFFNGEETKLPYHSAHTISSVEDATKLFAQYTFTYKEMKEINDLVIQGKVVSLTIDVVEEVTEKEEKQEAIFEKVESVSLDELATELKEEKKKKKTVKKKTAKKTGSKSFKSKK